MLQTTIAKYKGYERTSQFLFGSGLSRLGDNALNYTPAGQIEISTLWDQERQMAGIQIKDTGIGIAPSELNYVFDRFYRGQRVGQLTTPGAGLGLPLAQHIATQQGGKIEIKSQVDRGTTATLWLPLA